MWDLLEPSALSVAPQWQGLVGPGRPFPDQLDAAGQVALPAAFLAGITEPILVRLAVDEDAMVPLIEPGDLVLLDGDEAGRRQPRLEGVYALALPAESAVCRCRRAGTTLLLSGDNSRRSAPLPGRLPLLNRSILDVVRGRVVWSCREFGSG